MLLDVLWILVDIDLLDGNIMSIAMLDNRNAADVWER